MLGWVNLGRNKVRLDLIRLSKEDLVLVMFNKLGSERSS